ncbi:ribonuclease R [Gammaproteobacteria bacterium]|nr:ribonuclease R [Gammaproteobacteria bacterium]
MKKIKFSFNSEVEKIIKKFSLNNDWNKNINQDIDKYKNKKFNKKSFNRKDLKKLDFVTIDGEDAKDFDDAVYCEKHESDWKLYVAIADVAHYVENNSNIDKEARKRGTSVYFPGFVIPMLPEILSNNLCSLRPGEDKFTVMAEIIIGKDGKIKSYKFYNALISSSARLTYTQVDNFLNNKKSITDKNVIKNINNLFSLYKILKKSREKRHAVNFDTQEFSFLVSKNNEITGIKNNIRLESQKLIEECMIAANVASSLFIKKNKSNSLYRVHDEPTLEKIEDASISLKNLGYSLNKTKIICTEEINKIIELSKKKLDDHLVTSIILRAMARAEYTPKNIGHFGLSLKSYNHFTSPIRRYPDLIVHRIIKNIIEKKENQYDFNNLEKIGTLSSENERNAEAAERELQSILLCNYATKFIGKKFDATVNSVVNFGLFIAVKEEPIQGLIHISSLGNEYFIHNEKKNILIGDKSKKVFKVGDKIKVKLQSAFPSEKKIDFVLAK